MIQRIQTVYLLLTTLVAALFLSGNIIYFNNGATLRLTAITQKISGAGVDKFEYIWPLTALLVIVPLLSFFLIFLYKGRKIQMRLTLLLVMLILLTIGVCGYYVWNYIKTSLTDIAFSYKLILPPLMLIFSILAYRGIRKDEDIVRSYDRLR